MTETRDVELIIRAKNFSKRTLSEVRKEIEAVNAALAEQVAAADRGEGSLKDLEKNYRDLEAAMKSLLNQQSLIKTLQNQEAQLEKLQAKLGDASKRLREFQAVLGDAAPTARQQTQQTRLVKAVEKAEAALGKQVDRFASMRKQAQDLGIDTLNLAKSQDALLATGRDLAATNAQLTNAVETYSTRVKLATKAERELKETQAFDEKAAEAAKLVRAAEYAQFWTTELEKIDAAERKLANTTALNLAADRAVAAARGYTTLADASKRLVQNSRPVAAALEAITDPAASGRRTLAGIEEQVNSLAASVARIKGPVQDYKEQIRQLTDAQNAISRQGAAVDSFQRQIAVLRQARATFAQARAEALAYAQSIRSAEAPTEEMASTQRRLQAAVQAASVALQGEVSKTREMRDSLRQAGVETSNLAGTTARLVTAARTTTSTMEALRQSVSRYGQAAREAGQANNLFESGGRTTLSFMQRLRGEVLALAAAYVGLQGTIGLASDSLDAFSSKQGIQNQLAISTGNDPRAIGEAFEYVRGQADRVGLSFEDAAKGYAKFAAAAKLAGRSTQEIRFIFETFSEVGQVAQLSTDELNGVFKALEQVISKGKIQAEELRGQLGDRLFGAFEVAAKALKDQFPDLDKAMKNGEVTANQLVAIAEEYKKVVADQLPDAMASLRAQQNRLNTELFFFKTLIAESGFAESYERLIVRLTQFFQSEDGREFAQKLSDAFSAIADGLVFLIDNLDHVQTAIELAFGLKAAQLVAGLATGIAALIPQLIAMNAQLAAATGLVAGLQKAFLLLAAFFVGWKIGEALSNEFEIVRQIAVSLVVGLKKLFTQLEFAANVVWTSIAGNAKNQFTKVVNIILDAKDNIIRALIDLANAAGQAGIADKLASGLSDGARSGLTDVRAEVQKLQKQLEKDLAAIDEIGFDMFQDASDKARAEREKANSNRPAAAGATPSPGVIPGGIEDTSGAEKAQKEYEKLVNKRVALAEQLANQLATIEARIARNEKLSLQERLSAIDIEMRKVFANIEKLGKLPGGADLAKSMRTTLNGYVEALKVQETLKFNQEEQARGEKRINDLLALRTQLLQGVEAQQKAGLIGELEAKAKIADIDQRMVPQIQQSAQAMIQWALAHKEVFADQVAMDTFIAKLQAINDGLIEAEKGIISTADVAGAFASSGTNAMDSFAQAIANGDNAMDALGNSFREFAANFLRQIALMIIQQLLYDAALAIAAALTGGGGTKGLPTAAPGTSLSSLQASQLHTGGVVGSRSGGIGVMANPQWFAGAPRYHEGGVVGLRPNEVPAILEKGEEVLTADDPRHTANGGAGSGQAQPPVNVNNINVFDREEVAGEVMNAQATGVALLNFFGRNSSSIKQRLGLT